MVYREGIGFNSDPAVSAHDYIGTALDVAPPVGTPLRYFLEPIIGSLDYAIAQRTYSRVGMVGLSGGGWATTMLAAIDPRIERSYAVAGSVPMAYRRDNPANAGDWEQQLPNLYPGIDYPDLYLMAVAEPERHALLLHNEFDGCCFPGTISALYSDELRWYASQAEFGALSWNVAVGVSEHDISTSHRTLIINDFLSP